MLRQFHLLKSIKRSYLVTNKIKTILKGEQPLFIFNEVSRIARTNPVIMKLDSPEFKSLFTLELMTLASLFKNHNYEIRIAGGAVRDLLMGKKPVDVDFATTATPDQMKEIFVMGKVRLINTKGESHGTITARINNKENFEITTLRIDTPTDGRHAKVEFTKDWELDASRRDLTINSMFLDLDGTLYDYFNGYEDLKARRVLFVGESRRRIQEDYLRILRYFRFYGRIAELPDNHDPDVLDAIKENVKGLDVISGERIWSELFKILQGNFYLELMLTMLEVGIGPHIGLPENPDIDAFKYRCDITKYKPLHPAAMLTSFVRSEDEWFALSTRLRMSAFERNLGNFIVRHRHDITVNFKWCQKMTILNSNKGKLSDLKEYIKELLKHQGSIAVYHEYDHWEVPKFPVTGHHLRSLGVPLGQPIGKLMNKLKKYWVSNNFNPDCDELLKEVPRFLNEMGFNFKPPQ